MNGGEMANPIEQPVDVEMLKRMFTMYLDKYEEACVFRANDNAIRHEGATNVLEHLLISAGEGEYCNQKRSEIEKRRNAMSDVWRKMKND